MHPVLVQDAQIFFKCNLFLINIRSRFFSDVADVPRLVLVPCNMLFSFHVADDKSVFMGVLTEPLSFRCGTVLRGQLVVNTGRRYICAKSSLMFTGTGTRTECAGFFLTMLRNVVIPQYLLESIGPIGRRHDDFVTFLRSSLHQ